MTGSKLNERSRSDWIVCRCRSSALASTCCASSLRPSSIAWPTASSINAIPESAWTAPSWRKRASRRRSSCSAATSCSKSRIRSRSSRRRSPWRRSPWRSWEYGGSLSVNDRLAKRVRDRVCPRVGLELREDVADVALDGLLADEELRSYVRVRHAVGEELEDLPLARRQHVGLVLAGQEGRHQGRVDVPLALGDALDRAQQGL